MNNTSYLFPAVTAALNTRPTLVRVSFAILVLGFAFLVIVHIARLASITTDENRYVNSPQGVRIIDVLPGGASARAGLKKDDIIVAVNGRPVNNTEEAMVFIVGGSAGKSLYYTIDRGGTQFVAKVVLADFGLPLSIVIILLTSILFFLSSVIVMTRRPRDADARRYAWTMLVSAAYLPLLTFYSPYYYGNDRLSSLQIPIALILWGVTFASQYLLSHRYPVPRFQARWPGWLWVLFFGLIILLPGILILTQIVPYRLVTGIAVTLVIIAVMEIVIRVRLKFPRNPDYRGMSRHVQLAGVSVLASFVLAVFIDQNSVLQAGLLVFCAAPILLFYPIVKYRLFNLYFVMRQTSKYNASRLILAVVFLVLLVGSIAALSRQRINLPVPRLTGTSFEIVPLHSFPAGDRDRIEKGILLLAAMMIGGLLWIGWKSGRRMLDGVFHRGAYDYRQALKEFSQLSVHYSDTETLTSAVVDDLLALMHLRAAAFCIRDSDRMQLTAIRQITCTPRLEAALRIESPWLQQFQKDPQAAAVKNLADRDLFAGTGITFVAPVPLDGIIAGCLLLGEKLNETNFTTEDVDLLNNLAINIGDAMRTIRFYEAAKEQERLKRELEIARRIQLSALPSKVPEFPGLDVAAVSLPAFEVGGDFYEFLARHDGVTFLIGDVSGKGTSAALYLARIQGILRTIESYQPTQWELFTRLNTLIFDHIERNVYLTLSALRVDFLSNRIEFIRAGHLPLLYYQAAAETVSMHKPGGVGIGLEHTMFGEYLQPEILVTRPGDVYVLLTDGITEASNATHEQYGIERAADVLKSRAHGNAEGIMQDILSDVRAFSGGDEPHDDMTIVVVRVL